MVTACFWFLSVTVVTPRSAVTLQVLYLLNKVPSDHKPLIHFPDPKYSEQVPNIV